MGKIVNHPTTRLDWHKQMAMDRELSALAFRVAVVIGTFFNNKTGRTFVGYEKIGDCVGACRRTVFGAVKELVDRGHLIVEAGGGRAVANEYRMRLKTVQSAAPFSEGNTVQNPARNGAADCTTTLKNFSSRSNSTGAGAREASEPGGSDWQAIKGMIVDRHGQAIVDSWLGSVVAIISDGVLTIAAPTKFARGEITTRLGDDIGAAARAINPTITAVKVVVTDGAPATRVSRQIGDTRDDMVSERERDWRAKRSRGGGFGRLALELARQAREESGE